MGVSQSAFISELLAEPLAAMSAIMDALPAAGATPQDVKRAKGRSVDLIRNIVGEAQALVQSVLHDTPPAKVTLTAGPAQRRSKRAAGRAHPSQAVTLSRTARQGESQRASATAEDSGSGRDASLRPRRVGKASGYTAAPARARKTSGAPLKGGRRPRRGATKR